MIFCSGGFAQSPNSFSIALDKKTTKLRCVPCSEDGFCLVLEKKGKPNKQLRVSHYDTLFKMQFDTALTLSSTLLPTSCFYEDGALVIVCQKLVKSRLTELGTLYIYHPDCKRMEKREISGIPGITSAEWWHHYRGNFFFTVHTQNGKEVWFLPENTSQPIPFSFTRENPGQVLTTAVDTTQGKAIICFNTGERTMYFETDFYGKSSFANILNEPATHAQWLPIGHNHSVLMLYYEDDETFYIHPVNILNHKVMPSETIYCSDISKPNLPDRVKEKQTVITVPHTFVNFLPGETNVNKNRISCVTELYYLEYYNYFNGWYVEPRFNGYRYERADVHFFDTNGVFQTNVIFPYNEETSLHSHIAKKLKIFPLQNDILLYHQNAQELTTMLLDDGYRTKDPIRTTDLPLPKITFKKQRLVVDRFEPWYGDNQFMLTAFRINVVSQKKVGFMIRKLEYN
jgi:hypothetical protein